MATTGTYTFDPRVAELLEEAAERAGLDPATLGARHIKSALRSMKAMFASEWMTIGVTQWNVQQETVTLSEGQTSFLLPTGGIDILGMVLRREGHDIEMVAISRQDYLAIVDKTTRGRPDRYFLDKQGDLNGRRVYIWQAASNNTDQIIVDYLRQAQDIGGLSNTLQMPPHAFDAAAEGLAMRLAQKFAPERYEMLRVSYGGPRYPEKIGGKLELLRQADRDRSDLEVRVQYYPRTGRY